MTGVQTCALPISTDSPKPATTEIYTLSLHDALPISVGVAGVGGGATFAALIVLPAMGLPASLEGLAFIAGVDRILDMARTALNVVGNALAVLVIAKWEHKFDRKKALAYEREVLGKFDKTADQ